MIIWIASYPKSGNTYLRSFISSYYFSKKGKFDFDLLLTWIVVDLTWIYVVSLDDINICQIARNECHNEQNSIFEKQILIDQSIKELYSILKN